VKSDIERRATASPVVARDGDKVGGYALKWERYSRNFGGWVEQISRPAFRKSAGDGWPGVMARYNHSDAALLGTTAGATLRLAEDAEGLDYEVDLPDTTAGRDLRVLVARGDVTKSSFAFYTAEDDWSLTEQGFALRTIVAAQLVDVAPVNDPQYLDTSTGLRSLAQHRGMDVAEVTEVAEAGRLADLIARAATVIDLGAPVLPQPGQGETHPVERIAALRRLHDLRR
jgi:uncharacterized protein